MPIIPLHNSILGLGKKRIYEKKKIKLVSKVQGHQREIHITFSELCINGKKNSLGVEWQEAPPPKEHISLLKFEKNRK